MSTEHVAFLILDAEEDIEVLDTTAGWQAEDEWVPVTVPAGKYKAIRALNPASPDGLWIFVEGTRIGQRQDQLIEDEKNGIKVRLLEARPASEQSVEKGHHG